MVTEALSPLDINEQAEEEMAGGIPGEIGAVLTGFLVQHVYTHKLGRVFNADTDFTLPGIGNRRPDAAFVMRENLPENTQKAVPIPPDLAVEVVSETDQFNKADAKLLEYQQVGVKLIWVIRTVKKVIEVYRADGTTALLNVNDILDGENVVTGFKLPVQQLFDFVEQK
jgi:Uma2 family endonuclease